MSTSMTKFSAITQALVSDVSLLRRASRYSVLMGILEAASLCALVPLMVALVRGTSVWGLSVEGWLLVIGALAVVSAVVGYTLTFAGFTTSLDMIKTIHQRIGDQVAGLPLGWFHRPMAGRLSRMVSAELLMIGEIIAHMLTPLYTKLTVCVLLLVFTFAWDVRLGLVLLCSAPIFIGLSMISARLSHRGKAYAEPAEIELSTRIVEFTVNQAALRASGQSSHFPPLMEANTNWAKAKRKELWYEIGGLITGGVGGQIVVCSFLTASAFLATSGRLDPVSAVAFMGLGLRFMQVLATITEMGVGLQTRRPMIDQIMEILTSRPLPEPAVDAPMDVPGQVELDRVNFSYLPGTPVLKNVSMVVPPRSMVAIVGPSGCGKTTIARLISRFYEVDSGVVRVGGADVKELSTATLMGQLSMVFQDVYLFDDTLRANVAIGNPTATDEEIEEAARLAGVMDIIHRLPDGWDTTVGEGGRALSGGERQRVAIARALLKNAPIVLLDEATSALDPENEANIIRAVDQLRRHSTIVVIAHKLTTIRGADLIVVLDKNGSVEATGSHEELYARGGTYRAFWDARASSTGWQLT